MHSRGGEEGLALGPLAGCEMGAQELAHSRKHTLTVRVVRIVIVTRQLQHAMRRG